MNNDFKDKTKSSLDRKFYVGFACFAVSIGLGIIIISTIIFLNLDKFIEKFLKFYMVVGIPVICFISWPFMNKKIK